MQTVEQYCKHLGWTAADLSRFADISWNSANKAIRKENISARVKRQIAEALSKATGEDVWPGSIQW